MVMWCAKGGNWGGNGWGGNGGKGGGKMAAMMQMMQMMADGGMWGMDGGDWGNQFSNPAGGAAVSTKPWKSQLMEAVMKKKKGSLTKDDIKYEVNEVEGGYQASVTLEEETYVGEIAEGKKDAEHNAAKEACKALFPELLKGQGAQPQGKKRKAGEMIQMNTGMKTGALPLTAKGKFMNGVQMLKPDGSITKEDVTFATEQKDGKFVCTITIKMKDTSFTGEPSASTKEAEHSASAVAYDALKAEIEPLLAEKAEQKKQRKKETLAALVERTAAKRAAEKEAKKAIEN